MPMASRSALTAVLLLAACDAPAKRPAPGPGERSAPTPKLEDDDLAPKDVDPNAPPPELGKVKPADAPARAAKQSALELKPPPRPCEDPRPGTVATILYVTEVADERRPGGRRPCAMIFSSDKSSPYLDEEPRPSRVVKDMAPVEMKDALAELDALGLSTIPWTQEAADAPISKDRALYVLQGKARRAARKADLRDAGLLAFARIEKKLIALARRVK